MLTYTNLDGHGAMECLSQSPNLFILARVLEISTEMATHREEELDIPGRRNHARQGGTTTSKKEYQPSDRQSRLRQIGQSMGFSVMVLIFFDIPSKLSI